MLLQCYYIALKKTFNGLHILDLSWPVLQIKKEMATQFEKTTTNYIVITLPWLSKIDVITKNCQNGGK